MSDIDKVNSFVESFMSKFNSLINSIGRKYLIPNRYTIDDIKQYIAERLVQIMTNRLNDQNNKIEDPEKYFKSCLDFYCIEYQRMHGYIFELPKRPRKNCEEDEKHIRSYGFKYLEDMSTEEYNSLTVEDSIDHEKEDSLIWKIILSVLSKEEAEVIDCIFNKNLTWLETSKHLDVPQSTCWIRKDRAIDKIFKRFDRLDGEINGSIKKFLRSDPRVLGDFSED